MANSGLKLQYRSLTVTLVPAPTGGLLRPFSTDALHDTYRELTADYPYPEFRLLAGGAAAQVSNGSTDFVTMDPRLLQVKTEILLTPAVACGKTTAVLKLATKRLKPGAFAQCGIQITAQAPIPSSYPSAGSYVTNELMNAGEQADVLGSGFFGCLQFRRTTSEQEEQLTVEPLLTDDQFLFVSFDIQRTTPGRGLDELEPWLTDAFAFLRERASRLLRAPSQHFGS